LPFHGQFGNNGLTMTTARTGSEALTRVLGEWRRAGPTYVDLSAALRARILDGLIPARTHLPSERELATAIGVSRTTTTAAYDVLRREGYLESARGSGTLASLPTGGTVDQEFRRDADVAPAEAIDLTVAALPAPGVMRQAVELASTDLVRYLGGAGYDAAGLPILRESVAQWFRDRGIPTHAEQIVVSSGAQHALALVLQVLVGRRDQILFDSPSYPNAFEVARRIEARIVTVPILRTGWDAARVASVLTRTRPRVAFMIPDFHNPTGLLMREDDRSTILRAAQQAGTALVVDETFAELDLEPWRPTPPPMAAIDGARVITIGSMSKAYWGGLRVGWIRCSGPLAYRIARSRVSIDLATAVLEQLVAARLLEMRQAILAERRALVTDRRDALVSHLGRDLPHWSFVVPRGGLSLWVSLGRPIAADVASAGLDRGIRILPGSIFDAADRYRDRLRIPFTQPESVLRDAVSRLGAAEADVDETTKGLAS
jgi:DNA-binding transcriptional MocR family regulator